MFNNIAFLFCTRLFKHVNAATWRYVTFDGKWGDPTAEWLGQIPHGHKCPEQRVICCMSFPYSPPPHVLSLSTISIKWRRNMPKKVIFKKDKKKKTFDGKFKMFCASFYTFSHSSSWHAKCWDPVKNFKYFSVGLHNVCPQNLQLYWWINLRIQQGLRG